MAHYTTPRPAPQAKQRPLTEEEKKARIMQFLQQKREQFSLTILNGLCSNPEAVSKKVVVTGDGRQRTEINNGGILVTKAVEMADALMEKLYPMEEEKPAEEKPVETDFD
jgi:hypothetical protein